MTEPMDMIIPMLCEMLAENAAMHERTHRLIESQDRRLGSVEAAQVSYRQALSDDTLTSRLPTGEFEDLMEQLERKVRAMEGRG